MSYPHGLPLGRVVPSSKVDASPTREAVGAADPKTHLSSGYPATSAAGDGTVNGTNGFSATNTVTSEDATGASTSQSPSRLAANGPTTSAFSAYPLSSSAKGSSSNEYSKTVQPTVGPDNLENHDALPATPIPGTDGVPPEQDGLSHVAGDPDLPNPIEPSTEMPDHVADFATVDTVAVTGAGEKTFADPGVKDIGWNEPPSAIPAPFVAGVQNDELWTLVRRFNKQMYHVKATDVPAAPGVLDLKIAEEEDFSPDKLRANFERLYVTVIIGMLGFTKHLARLSSWNEPIRTGYFCMVYFAAWWLDLLLPFFLSLIVLLTAYPPARDYLFPPAPLALVSSKTGNLQTPRAGTLGSGDSLTGAVEEHPGEAVEQEASNFLTGFASLAVGTILGKHPDGDADEEKGKSEPIDKMIPDPSNLAATSVDVKDQAQGKAPGTKSDPTKQPMEVIIWTKARPVMRMIADLADVWEMFANAMSPTPPFNHVARLRLAYVVTPLILVTAFVNGAMIVKSVGFGVGCGVFGRPVLTAAAHWLNRVYPQWPQLLDLRKTLLLGVPTNAQLTLTLLRLGEANHVPLPPPPASEGPPPSQPSSPIVKHEDLPEDLKASELEVNPAPESAPEEAHGHGEKTDTKHKVMSKIAGLLKGGAKVGVSSVLGTDRLKAAFGSEKAKERLGVLPARDDRLVDGPSMFSARFHGKKGHVVISSTANPPCVSFVRDDAKRSADGAWEPVFSIALNDINELKKVGGLSWKGKLVVGWAYERPVYDGLDIVDARGETWTLRAMQRRDELFNRLLASVSHQWESW